MLNRLKTLNRTIQQKLISAYFCVSGRKCMYFPIPYIGIGNRIKAIATQYSYFGKGNMTVYWGICEWVTDKFENLFCMTDAPGFVVVSKPITKLYPNFAWPWKRGLHIWEFWREGEPHIGYDWQYQKTPKDLVDKYEPFFKQLKPSEQVMARIEMVKLPPREELVTVHVRNNYNDRDTLAYSTLGALKNQMKMYPQTQKFFVSFMEECIAEDFRQTFPGQILELPNKKYKSMVDAVADMYLLGCGHHMICSPHSTFSEMAWWWGGANMIVTSPDSSMDAEGSTAAYVCKGI